MAATLNIRHRLVKFVAPLSALILALSSVAAETNFLGQAEAAYQAAVQARATNTQSLQAAIDVARTAFDNADLAQTDRQREPIALAGIDAARAAIAKDANSAGAHYYLALCLGQLA